MNDITFDPVPLLHEELNLPPKGIRAVLDLLAERGTVPFIARYRKEATGGLDEVQIRAIQERSTYLKELDERRRVILESIAGQGALTEELTQRINACRTKQALEDLYLPFKPKRRTRGTVAKERGLEPLAQAILAQSGAKPPEELAVEFVRPAEGLEDPNLAVPDVEAALKGARDIVAEQVAETAEVRALCRKAFGKEGTLASEATGQAKEQRSKYEQYYAYREPVKSMPSHRFLAIRRGEREGLLRVRIEVDEAPLLQQIYNQFQLEPQSPWAPQLRTAIDDAFQRLIAPSVETDVRVELKQRADIEAVEVFADNLENVLLAAPMGEKPVLGIDPGLRTGCKCAAVDSTGKFLEHVTINLVRGDDAKEGARTNLAQIINKHRPAAIAVGNGTGGREAEAFVREVVASEAVQEDLRNIPVVQVNEAGASVYSASEVAREEFPTLDLTVRGAISIARRLQDPLAELVKVDPKSIGVGQYQHDVHQPLLARKLDEVVESCVNRVGVSLNTASAPLLARVAGIGPKLAKSIVMHREATGLFSSREQLLEVSGLGPRTFEQAAGFLRIRGGTSPLDASAVHPERYALVETIARDMNMQVEELVGNQSAADSIDISRYVGGDVGEPTLRDIVEELKKPGRDPRASFEPPRFRADVHTLEDLTAGMELEGVVTNVTAFGAFVDVGVHQDGLVHISQLADRFVKDPHEVVRAGDRLTVRVLEVDLDRRRISLTARKEAAGAAPGEERRERSNAKGGAKKARGGRAKGDGQRSAQGRNSAQAKGKDGRQGDNPRRAGGGRGKGGGKPDKPRFSNNPFAGAFK